MNESKDENQAGAGELEEGKVIPFRPVSPNPGERQERLDDDPEAMAKRVNALSFRKRKKLDRFKRKLWGKVSAYMERGEFEGTDKFNFHMQTWVESLARHDAKGPEDRELVLLASDMIQIRFWTIMRKVLADSGL